MTFNTYYPDDQLATVEVDPSPVMSATAPLVESYSYDIIGQQTGFEDFDGRVQSSSYDGAGRVTQSTSSYQSTPTITTTDGYDPDGNFIEARY